MVKNDSETPLVKILSYNISFFFRNAVKSTCSISWLPKPERVVKMSQENGWVFTLTSSRRYISNQRILHCYVMLRILKMCNLTITITLITKTHFRNFFFVCHITRRSYTFKGKEHWPPYKDMSRLRKQCLYSWSSVLLLFSYTLQLFLLSFDHFVRMRSLV